MSEYIDIGKKIATDWISTGEYADRYSARKYGLPSLDDGVSYEITDFYSINPSRGLWDSISFSGSCDCDLFRDHPNFPNDGEYLKGCIAFASAMRWAHRSCTKMGIKHFVIFRSIFSPCQSHMRVDGFAMDEEAYNSYKEQL